jgi:hypothetical protein
MSCATQEYVSCWNILKKPASGCTIVLLIVRLAISFHYYMAGRSGWKWNNLIGSLSGRNPAVRTRLSDWFVSKLKTNFFRRYDKHLIDRACSVRIGGYWSCTFLPFYEPRLRLGPYKHKKYSTNIPLSVPHALSITSISCHMSTINERNNAQGNGCVVWNETMMRQVELVYCSDHYNLNHYNCCRVFSLQNI